jgi:hypothetical protein
MKRIFFRIAVFAIIFSSMATAVLAETIKVEAMEDFSTATPSTNFRVKILDQCTLPGGTILCAGSILLGQVSDVEHAKRLKQDGYFEFVPTEVTIDGNVQKIENPTVILKVADYVPLNPKQIAGNVAKTAAGYAVKGATQGISFVQGVVQAQNGDRLKSGLTKVYKDSPLSYIEQGSELSVKVGDILILVVKEIPVED